MDEIAILLYADWFYQGGNINSLVLLNTQTINDHFKYLNSFYLQYLFKWLNY